MAFFIFSLSYVERYHINKISTLKAFDLSILLIKFDDGIGFNNKAV